MGTSITIKVRSIVLGIVLALVLAFALVAAYAVGAGTGGPPTAAAAATTRAPSHGTITMRGTGKSTGVPDELAFNLAVHVSRPDVATAMDESTRTMRRSLAALKPYDVRRRDVQTTGLSIDPDYAYRNGQEQITGYTVTQRSRVTVRDLSRAGKAIAAAVRAGGNAVRVTAVGLSISDRESLLATARAAAVRQATAKAEQYAHATSQHLGQVVTLREVGGTPAPQPYLSQLSLRAAGTAGTMPVPIRAGQQELAVSVAVVWSFA